MSNKQTAPPSACLPPSPNCRQAAHPKAFVAGAMHLSQAAGLPLPRNRWLSDGPTAISVQHRGQTVVVAARDTDNENCATQKHRELQVILRKDEALSSPPNELNRMLQHEVAAPHKTCKDRTEDVCPRPAQGLCTPGRMPIATRSPTPEGDRLLQTPVNPHRAVRWAMHPLGNLVC
ncbi:uncharacterized protein K460DRAFT_360034 [Cucurbitaria berberidis CBS 394.84]|uniref:Uncharacterized protein n=1 Tax=Cucurbitaria berberidis CBS 394.84 TaxID=1168544 RepID=A0A9P4G7A5_9PLEO|nr:uncharacterized protein K460DRAFT_360034 [Cucurbitaria berberidis CBS 394.84]KAF1840345.1 hypothetical protein K460DRAFT_360034 [Cucurbitaria berberidis CBS 394.84]